MRASAALGRQPGAARGRLDGSEDVKLGKSVFAIDVQGRIVVKLSAGNVQPRWAQPA